MNAVVEMPRTELAAPATPLTPMAMIERALASGTTPETLEKLLTLQERWEANQARKAFIAAMSLARVKFAPILKQNDGYASRYKYETLSNVMDAVDGPLGEHGFSYDWVTEDLPDGRIRVTCVVTHEAGHSRSNSLSGDPKDTADAKANMNGFQRMGGAVTYLQRYTLKAALGIAASKDTDGAMQSTDVLMEINADQFQELKRLLEESGETEQRMLAYVKAEQTETLTLVQYAKAKAAMLAKISLNKQKEVANAK
jgi:hypothetical protein